MKNYYISPVSIFFLLISFCSQAKEKKGCTYSCTHEMSGNLLTIKIGVTYGYDCDWTNVGSIIEFGDGATASVEGSSTLTHHYCCAGTYDVTVNAPDINNSEEFIVYIGDSVGDAGCVPSFSYQKTYDELNKKFMISCIRTDTCQLPNISWYATGQPQIWGDSIMLLYPGADSGEVKTICLEQNKTQYGNPVCKEVWLSAVINEPIDSAVSVHVFPNPVDNTLQVEVTNLNDGVEIEVYSPDGRSVFNYKVQPSTVKSELSINMKDFSPGIYFMKATSGGNYSFVQKIVKE